MNPADINQQLAELTRLMTAGNLDDVERRTRELLEQYPQDPRLLCLLGRTERLLGRHEPAGEHLAQAARLAPQALQVKLEQGYLALAQESYANAERHFAEIVQRRPDSVDALFNLGVALRQQGRHAHAITALERCLALSRDRREQVHTELGTAHIMQRHENEALEHFQQALAIDPDYAPALHGVGMVKSAFGEFDDAADCFRAAMRSDPDFVEAYQQLVSIRRFDRIDDPDIRVMEDIVADGQRPALTRETLHYALGKVHDDCGGFERAFQHFAAANELKKARLPAFDLPRLQRRFDRLIAFFDRDRVTAGLGYRDASNLPILVFGMPRSGTTLVEQVLASHSLVDAGGEQSYIENAVRTLLNPYPDALHEIDKNALQQLSAGYLAQLGSCQASGRHVTDKMPANFMHAGLVRLLLPNAKLVYCRRNRLDNALSIYFQNMPTGHHYANDLAQIDAYYREHERLMQHWLDLFGDNILTVDYEAMVADFEAGARRLIEFCDLPWEEQALDYRSRKGPVATLSLWQVRQPIYSNSVERWKNYRDMISGQINIDDRA